MADEPRHDRRSFLAIVLFGSGAYAVFGRGSGDEGRNWPARVLIARFDAAGNPTGVIEVDTLRKSDAEWRKALPLDSYMVTRRKDTEMAFAGAFHNFVADGLYRCICCDTAVFDSRSKFESGTGWPSFTEPIANENVRESLDVNFVMRQTEVKCARCGAHLGHVFDDGPPPGGLRYCINSVALRFVGSEAL
jgi:peptide-methionine (R)-S-oxide reductase